MVAKALTDNWKVEILRDSWFGADLTLVDAGVAGLDVFDLKDPILVAAAVILLVVGRFFLLFIHVRVLHHREALVGRVREHARGQDMQIALSDPGNLYAK